MKCVRLSQTKIIRALKDELGDLLLQVVFHSQIADESKIFNFDEVVDGICKKNG
jgi:NTP pyrophosphatase (non-canonical NTP hydrolase)